MTKLDSKFWKNKKVLVTGHTGFKGSWLSEWLLQMGAKVSGYSLAPETQPNLFGILELEKRTQSKIGDIRNYSAFASAVAEFEPEIVFHLAAQALVRRSYNDPIETYSTNVMGTVNTLEIIRKTESVRTAVVVTSDKCYENLEQNRAFAETDAMGGHDPYSNSKGCAELVVSAYRNSYFSDGRVKLASARAGNVIGGGDWSEDRLIPDMVRAFQGQRAVQIRNPNSVRPWQHVLDPVSGYLSLAQALASENGEKFTSGWNFGPDEEDAKTVREVVTQAAEIWGSTARWQSDSSTHPHEARFLRLNSSKSRENLEWKPTWGLQRSLKETVEWYRLYYTSPDQSAERTRAQIQSFTGAQS